MGAHRGTQVSCLSTLVLLLLAIGTVAMPTPPAGPAVGPAVGAAVGAATNDPGALPAQVDVRLLALRDGTELDVHSGAPQHQRPTDPLAVTAERVPAARPPVRSGSPAHQGRAPPRTR